MNKQNVDEKQSDAVLSPVKALSRSAETHTMGSTTIERQEQVLAQQEATFIEGERRLRGLQ